VAGFTRRVGDVRFTGDSPFAARFGIFLAAFFATIGPLRPTVHRPGAGVKERLPRCSSDMMARIVAGLALSAASALMLHFSFPPYGLWPLAVVGFVPMLVAKYRVMPARLSSLAPAVAIGGWFALWMLPVFGGSGSWMSWIPLGIFLLSFLLDRGDRAFHERTGWRWFVVEGAVAWLGIEMVRSLVPVMGTWGFIGYPMSGLPWLIQPVGLFGIFGLDLAIMVVNYGLGLAAIAILDRWRPPARGTAGAGIAVPAARARRQGIAAAAIAAAWTVASLVLFMLPESGIPVRVAAVQVPGRGSGGMSYEKDPVRREALFRQLVEGTREAARQGARLVVWPEGSLDFDPAARRRDEITSLARETGAYLVIGYMVEVPGAPWRNEAVTVDPSGAFLAAYGKDHPVVFGGERGTSLHAYPVHETSFGRLGTIICYDLDFTDTARKLARAGAGIVAVPSLDWPAIAGRHSAHLVLRAVENHAAMIKADGGYDSLVVDARGRIRAKTVTPAGEGALLVADVVPGAADAAAIRLGDWIGWLCLAGFAFFAVFKAIVTRRKRRR
jgi:apolipoprotein N-acyltransferase